MAVNVYVQTLSRDVIHGNCLMENLVCIISTLVPVELLGMEKLVLQPTLTVQQAIILNQANAFPYPNNVCTPQPSLMVNALPPTTPAHMVQ